MLTKLGQLHRPTFRRTSAAVAGLVLATVMGAASAPAASAAPAVSQSPAAEDLVYQLLNYGSYGLCLDIASGSNQSIVNTCNDMPDATQAWEFPGISPAPYVQIEDLNANCLGVEGASIAQGADVVITSCALTTNRKHSALPDRPSCAVREDGWAGSGLLVRLLLWERSALASAGCGPGSG